MLITLIIIALLIVGAVCLIIESKMYSKTYYHNDWLFSIGIVLVLLMSLTLIFCGVFIIGVQTARDIDYQNALYEREMLEYRIEHMEENIVGNEMLYNDIVGFNNRLRTTKKWANNPWTSWFYNKKIAEIDYVEIDRGF